MPSLRPRAFLSYRHVEHEAGPDIDAHSQRHRAWVAQFAIDLRSEGVDVFIDQDLRDKIEKRKKRSKASQVAIMVRSPAFIQWLREKADPEMTRRVEKIGGWTGELSHRYVRYLLRIESLRHRNRIGAIDVATAGATGNRIVRRVAERGDRCTRGQRERRTRRCSSTYRLIA